jgi:hypothetical protein
VQALPTLSLETWIPEGRFLAQPDTVEFKAPDGHGHTRDRKRQIRPDGYFAILDHERLRQGQPARARFLLEVDMATHRDKVVPGLAYLMSSAYAARFGDNSGRWLVVTTGPVRLNHLRHQAQQAGGQAAGVFWFSTLEEIKGASLLTNPIWHVPGQEHPVALLPSHRTMPIDRSSPG